MNAPDGRSAETFIVFEQGDMTSRTVCAFCRQEISQTILTPCCESARRCQERQANDGIERPMKPQKEV